MTIKLAMANVPPPHVHSIGPVLSIASDKTIRTVVRTLVMNIDIQISDVIPLTFSNVCGFIDSLILCEENHFSRYSNATKRIKKSFDGLTLGDDVKTFHQPCSYCSTVCGRSRSITDMDLTGNVILNDGAMLPGRSQVTHNNSAPVCS